MLFFSALFRIMLVLALVAGGTADAGAATMDPAADATAAASASPCHESEPAGLDVDPPPAGMACCGEGPCSCDCVHAPPCMAVAGSCLTAPVHAGLLAVGSLRAPRGASASPDIRPPIA
jgi:hypothetical protein